MALDHGFDFVPVGAAEVAADDNAFGFGALHAGMIAAHPGGGRGARSSVKPSGGAAMVAGRGIARGADRTYLAAVSSRSAACQKAAS